MSTPNDDELVEITVPLDRLTLARLIHLCNACDAAPATVAASLLHDILKDDAEAHGEGCDADGATLH